MDDRSVMHPFERCRAEPDRHRRAALDASCAADRAAELLESAGPALGRLDA